MHRFYALAREIPISRRRLPRGVLGDPLIQNYTFVSAPPELEVRARISLLEKVLLCAVHRQSDSWSD